MLPFALWPILALIMGIAILVAAAIVGTLGWCTVHLLRDVFFGDDGRIWCPVHKWQMQVHGVPRGFLVPIPFVGLRRCEQFGPGHIRCAKTCLVEMSHSEPKAA